MRVKLDSHIEEQTRRIIKDNGYIDSRGNKVVFGARNGNTIFAVDLYPSEISQSLVDISAKNKGLDKGMADGECKFFLRRQGSFVAAQGYELPLVLSAANARYAGNSFLYDTRAQEAAFCRKSTLYASISSDKAGAMYRYNKELDSPVDSDYLIISPNVFVFRGKDFGLLDNPYNIAVASVPAPDLTWRASNVDSATIDKVIHDRLQKFLEVASYCKYKTLVLGAWGYREFGCNSIVVARAFYDLFFKEGYSARFSTVIFAIAGLLPNYVAFEAAFREKLSK